MKKNWIITIVVLLMLLNVASLGFMWWTNSPRANDRKEHKKISTFVVQELQLDAKQQDEYENLMKLHHQEMRKAERILMNARDKFFDHLSDVKPDSNSVKADALKIGEAETEMNLITIRHFQALKAICNEQQQKKLESLMKEILHRMKSQGPGPKRNGPPPQEGHQPPPPRSDDSREGNPPPMDGENDGPPPPKEGPR